MLYGLVGKGTVCIFNGDKDGTPDAQTGSKVGNRYCFILFVGGARCRFTNLLLVFCVWPVVW